MDEAQKAEIERVVTDFNKQIAEMRMSMRQSPETLEKMKALRYEMEAARQANDQARLTELRDKFAALRKEEQDKRAPIHEKMQALQEKAHGELAALMRPEQKEAFEKAWEELSSGRGRQARLQNNPRLLRALILRLKDLTNEQKEQVMQVFEQSEKALRDARDPLVRETENKKCCDGMLALLTPTQKEEVEKQLAGRLRGGRPVNPAAHPAGQPPAQTEPGQQPQP